MFLNPIMLAGIAGAVLPLVLHFLSRARYRSVHWGGMMFLDLHPGLQYRGSRIKELTLLLLRMALVATLAIALSRPVLGTDAMGTRQTSLVILQDRSASLEVVENGPPRLESARRAATSALGALQPGDQAAVVLLPETEPMGPAQFTSDLQSLVVRLNDARAGAAPARMDLVAGLNAAAKLLENAPSANRQIAIVCDRQAINWRDITPDFAQAWKKTVTDSNGKRPELFVIPVGGTEAGNVAIESVEVTNLPIVQNVTAEVEVRVRNYDTIPSGPISLTLGSPNYCEPYRTKLNLAAGGVETVRCPVRLWYAGSQILPATIEHVGGIALGKHFDTAIDVMSPIEVLVITGQPLDAPLGSVQSGADLIHLALSPFEAAGQTSEPDMAKVHVISADTWTEKVELSRYAALILANVPRIEPWQAKQIEQYVYSGGGLLVAPGNMVRSDDYNTVLLRNGDGVIPAELQAAVAADGSQATSLLGLELSHPIFRFLKDRQDPLPKITVGRYFLSHVVDPRANVLGRYASGQPFLIESSFGHGRVLLMTTSLDAEWTTLPFTSDYLPFVQSAVRYLAAGSQPNRNLSPGEPIVVSGDTPFQAQITLDPANPSSFAAVDAIRTANGYEIRYDNTSRPGRYQVRIRSRPWIYFMVREPRDEVDTRSLTDQRVRDISQFLGCEWVDSDPQAIASALTRSRKHQELWPFLICAVIVMALLELLLERAWTMQKEKGAAQ